ncbi:MAG: beta/gamma crystallin-related protein [Phenylobacterium sp.]|nr:beta/gamma crystallin-related protein [Phenylobacterium sp.]
MKIALGLFALATVAVAGSAYAQRPPPGSYLNQCRNVSVQGQFLHAQCRDARGSWATSSINLESCGSDISVGRDGGLVCFAQGVGPGPGRPPGGPYPPPPGVRPPPPGYGGYGVTIYDRFGFRGRALQLRGPTPNLDGSRFNDRVASIQLPRRSGPWLVCEDSNYRGRCVTVSSDVRDVGRLGMLNRISSLRPLDGWGPR